MQGIKVAGLAVGMTFVWAAIVALVFRFPFPFEGYRSGFGAMINSVVAVLIYGVFFGGLLVPIVLALAIYGVAAHWNLGATSRARLWTAATVGAFIPVMIMATLDYMIGNW
jgi:hypothetical protein